MSKEFKPQAYFLIRRGWYDQLVNLCDGLISKKGKDPVAVYWKAFGLGMTGNTMDCLRLLESFHSRRDMQYPVSLALLFFHKRATVVDHEAIDSITSELSAAEDVTKEAGLVMAARFALYSQDYSEATRIARKISDGRQGSSSRSAFEIEASTVEQWCIVHEIEEADLLSSQHHKDLKRIDAEFANQNNSGSDYSDPDSMSLWAKSRLLAGESDQALSILNQTIAIYPWFLPALAEKALILCSIGEWEQTLDTAQRLLDADHDHLDALKVIAVHAFIQESHPDDAVQKFEDFCGALHTKEPVSLKNAIETASLFSIISSRQPRAIQICSRLLTKTLKNSTGGSGGQLSVTDAEISELLCTLGHIQILQGPGLYEKSMKSFRESTKRDPNNVQAMLGMILCQLYEGAADDAESQIELLLLMHGEEDLGYLFFFLQSLQLKNQKDKKIEHQTLLDKCFRSFLEVAEGLIPLEAGKKTYLGGFDRFIKLNPDFAMVLAIEYFSHMESASNMASFIPSTSSLLNSGGIKGQIAQMTKSQAVSNAPTSPNAGLGLDTLGTWGAQTAGNITTGLTSGGGSSGQDIEMAPAVQNSFDLLQRVLRLCPGMIPAYVELARGYSNMGMFDSAREALQQCLSLQPQSSPVLVAMAQVEAAQQQTAAADRMLEQALSCDFSVRQASRFRLVKAVVRAQQARLDESITEIEQIMTLPEFSFSLTGNAKEQAQQAALEGIALNMGVNYSDSMRLTEDDRVGAFVCYASVLSKSRRLKEANKVLSFAKTTFAGTSQEVQVLVAASQLFVEKSDFDAAIRMLDKIAIESPSYSRAQLIKADIVLTHNHDKEGFAKCFQQLVEREPSAKNCALLGEAYLRILNPEAAIDALENAYKMDPTNGRLRGRIGRALVATHEYHRAVEFYEAAIREINKQQQHQERYSDRDGTGRKEGESSTAAAVASNASMSNDLVTLSHDLAKLFIKLGRAESSIRVLKNILHENPLDVTSMRQDVTTWLLLAQVESGNGTSDAFLDALEQAKLLQKDVIIKLRGGGGISAVTSAEQLESEKFCYSNICERLGSVYLSQFHPNNHNDKQLLLDAESLFQESLQQNPQNTHAMLGLAKLYLQRNDLEQCQQQCNRIITAEPQAEEAAILLSEVLSRSEDPDSSVTPLINMLKLCPTNYKVLEKAISNMRRAGKLEECPALFETAKKYDPRCQTHAGFHFSQGLYARYTNDVGKAISCFNLARKDETWGSQSLTNMVELYLNPDQEGAWEEREQNGPLDDVTRAHIAAAEELLRELQPIARDELRVRVLENYCGLSTRNKASVDKAMQSFIEILEHEQDYLPAVLGMATGFMIEKNQHKARNLLKRVGKMELTQHDGEDFERANLLLAKFYIDKGKNDVAQELCKKTLLQNKSSSAAWELLGLVFEKEQQHDLAADAYHKAWKLQFEASATVGFKLAFSYLKCNKFVEAIDICEIVLQQYPDYPRISEDILKKAQESIRTSV